ncbi:hypothetical protein [Bradyrhizobium sp. 2S1]|uniref:hypothetical protein n=1 Tax=Bradyrhizobium sp. 2S1 TaxID=1404429 RepID=UPI00140E158A|nr:hypothetical protein [Bradyrhizobium sp. 2S1]MCK7665826.1 hypothetical protein [Bradyrhizobium sp. 2S1]
MKSVAPTLVALAFLSALGSPEARSDEPRLQETAQHPPRPPSIDPKKLPAPPKIENGKRVDFFFDPALDQLGVYLTAPVADDFRRISAAKFLEGAAQAGFNVHETTALSRGMVAGDLRYESGGKSGWIASANADVRIAAEPGSSKAGYLQSFRTVERTTVILEKYSTIRLLVNPAPPRDYNVTVNGEVCPATEAGIYKVMPGESVVNATRPKKPKCEWRGSIAPGAVQEVKCAL